MVRLFQRPDECRSAHHWKEVEKTVYRNNAFFYNTSQSLSCTLGICHPLNIWLHRWNHCQLELEQNLIIIVFEWYYTVKPSLKCCVKNTGRRLSSNPVKTSISTFASTLAAIRLVMAITIRAVAGDLPMPKPVQQLMMVLKVTKVVFLLWWLRL